MFFATVRRAEVFRTASRYAQSEQAVPRMRDGRQPRDGLAAVWHV